MKVNQSGVERILRAILGVVLLVLKFAGVATGGLGIAFIVIGAIALLTGVVGFCPIYGLFKFSTNKAS